MTLLAEIKRLETILAEWAPSGPADDRYFDAKDIVRQLDTYFQTHPISDYASGKISALQGDLDDLYYRDGKHRRRVAPFQSHLESAQRYVAMLKNSLSPPDE
jgi:hypothetical protein